MTTYAEAIADAGRILDTARRERDEAAAIGGPEAVAESAYFPGALSRDDIARQYRELAARTGACAA